MIITKDMVLALAESLDLSAEKMQRIRDVVHFMDDEDLKMLNQMLVKIQSEKTEQMQQEISLREDAMNKYTFFKKTLVQREAAKVEIAEQAEACGAADSLINNL